MILTEQVLLLLLLIAASLMPALISGEDSGSLNFFDEFGHSCVRNCTADPSPRVCSYSFRIEWYLTMSKACFDCPMNFNDCFRPHCVTADGFKKAFMVVNRQLSGPGIHVCEGDTVNVTVYNMMEVGEGTSIHWHGMHHSGTQHMDGVAMVTQCPINAHSWFTYKFTASPAGTHFWHSHSGVQRSEGIFGPLIVRQSADPHASQYDIDLPRHTLLLTDWIHELVASKFAAHHYSNGTNKPESAIINGRGTFTMYPNGTYTPRYVLKVTPGKRHRIRVISSGSLNCPFVISVANHSLMVIASDGAPFEPIQVDSFIIYAGERFDFVLKANQTPGNYLLMAAGVGDCDARFFSVRQSAIVSYEGVEDRLAQNTGNPAYADMLASSGRQLNPYNREADADHIAVSSLKALPNDAAASPLGSTVDAKFYVAFDFEIINNAKYNYPLYYPISAVKSAEAVKTPMINNVAMQMPPVPLLYQMSDVNPSMICNNTEFNKAYETEFKSCIHALRIGLNQTVELILIDKGFTFDASHPFHLHGQYFRVIGIERINSSVSVDQVKARDAAGLLRRNLDRPVIKDTVVVPDGGYTIVRFRATNPGPWLLHCHLEFHVELGMTLALLVGDPADWATRVPDNFPRCGPWTQPGPSPWAEQESKLRRDYRDHMLALGLCSLAIIIGLIIAIILIYLRNTSSPGGMESRVPPNFGSTTTELTVKF